MSRPNSTGATAEHSATLERKLEDLLRGAPTEVTLTQMLQTVARLDVSNAESGVPSQTDDITTNPTEGKQVKVNLRTTRTTRTISKKTKADSSASFKDAARGGVRKNTGKAHGRSSRDIAVGRVDSGLPSSPVSVGPATKQSLIVKLKVPMKHLIRKEDDEEALEAAKILCSLRYGKW